MSSDDPHCERVRPRGPLVGVGQVPGSKSIAQRCLVWSAAATGPSLLRGVTACGDVDSAVEAVRALG
ncbi:MAG: 3-phosphoshikimate 1-carboxyvinyltransferase, partial [Planctomycetota bacterium]